MPGADASQDGDALTADHDTRDDSQPPASKRRRTGGTSSRGVANLTPEQLARKRANDREAQRAIRERTKNQIDRLNQRIRDLESQQPYHDLQVVLREKEAIQAENTDIRKRLESVVSIIQPVLGASGRLNELAAAAEQSPLPLPVAPPSREPTSHPHDNRAFSAHPHDIASPHNGVQSPAVTDPGRPWLYPGDGPTSHLRRWSDDSSPYEQPRPPPHLPPDMPFDERMGVDFLLDNGQRRVDPHLPPPVQQQTQQHQADPINTDDMAAPERIPHLVMPRTLPATCPLDGIMLDFLIKTHHAFKAGVPIKQLSGPLYPNFTALVYPDRSVDSHALSKLFTDILRTFPDICGLPEQVAIVFIMFLVMRWQIEPTQENYDRLPDWVTPRASQLFVPHPYWINHLPWPKLRDRLITTQPFIPFDSFFIPFTTTVSLNWPYKPQDCLLPASRINSALSSTSSMAASSPFSTAVHAGSPQGPPTPQPAGSTPGTTIAVAKEDDQWLINPAFETHLRDLSNWSLGQAFRTTFPHFADAVHIKEGR